MKFFKSECGQVPPEAILMTLGFILGFYAGSGITHGIKKIGCKIHIAHCNPKSIPNSNPDSK